MLTISSSEMQCTVSTVTENSLVSLHAVALKKNTSADSVVSDNPPIWSHEDAAVAEDTLHWWLVHSVHEEHLVLAFHI